MVSHATTYAFDHNRLPVELPLPTKAGMSSSNRSFQSGLVRQFTKLFSPPRRDKVLRRREDLTDDEVDLAGSISLTGQ
jgi:hypothetical protein